MCPITPDLHTSHPPILSRHVVTGDTSAKVTMILSDKDCTKYNPQRSSPNKRPHPARAMVRLVRGGRLRWRLLCGPHKPSVGGGAVSFQSSTSTAKCGWPDREIWAESRGEARGGIGTKIRMDSWELGEVTVATYSAIWIIELILC